MAKAAWTRKEGKNPEGGLNQKGRDSYNKETGGNLKAPSTRGGKQDVNLFVHVCGYEEETYFKENC